MSDVGDRLRAAAQRVRAGWCQSEYMDEQGVCALGALVDNPWAVMRSLAGSQVEIHALVRALGVTPHRIAVQNLAAVWEWNDAKGQTAENVAVGLELAAILADEEARPFIVVTERWTLERIV